MEPSYHHFVYLIALFESRKTFYYCYKEYYFLNTGETAIMVEASSLSRIYPGPRFFLWDNVKYEESGTD